MFSSMQGISSNEWFAHFLSCSLKKQAKLQFEYYCIFFSRFLFRTHPMSWEFEWVVHILRPSANLISSTEIILYKEYWIYKVKYRLHTWLLGDSLTHINPVCWDRVYKALQLLFREEIFDIVEWLIASSKLFEFVEFPVSFPTRQCQMFPENQSGYSICILFLFKPP